MKYTLCLVLLTLGYWAYCQEPMKTYSIGDTVDKDLISEIADNANLQVTSKGLGNELLILDFFATSCKGCIHALPRIDSIQKKYSNAMRVVAITYENRDRLDRFIEHNEIGKKVSLNYISGDTIIKKSFPHQSISHIVWIYKGIVKAITYSDYLNEENVAKLFDGKQLHLPVKREVSEFDYSSSLFILNNTNIPEMSMPKKAYYTAVTAYLAGVHPSNSFTVDSVNKVAHYCFFNHTIPQLYFAVADLMPFAKSHIIAEVDDLDNYFYKSRPAYRELWDSAHRFCYDAFLPTSMSSEDRRRKMNQDLNDYFGLSGIIERRKVDCIVIDFDPSLVVTKRKDQSSNFNHQYNIPTLADLEFLLNKEHLGLPFIVDTGNRDFGPLYLNNVDDLDVLSSDLKNYGIILKKEKREMDMFILKEKPSRPKSLP